MANINLSQSSLARKRMEASSVFDKSLITSMGLIVITVGTFVGLKYYNGSLEQEMTDLTTQMQTQTQRLESPSVNALVDFQERSKTVSEKLDSKDLKPEEMFALIERTMVKGASLESYVYDLSKRTLTLKVETNDFKEAAQQVMSFKEQESFKTVTVGSSSRKETTDGGPVLVVSEIVISL